MTPNKSKADEHQVQLTITEAVKRSHDYGAVSSLEKNIFCQDRDRHDSMNNLDTVGNFHIPNELIRDDSQYVNVSYKLDNDSEIDKTLSDYMESHPIIRKIYSLLFNHDFRVLYEYAIGMNNIYPDLVEMENIEFGVKFQQVCILWT